MTSSTGFDPDDVVGFWREAGPSRWFRKDEAFDRAFRERFIAAHEAAARGELNGWLRAANGALALCILLDQFPRNAFRATARMFATDAKAREVARAAVEAGFDAQVDEPLRQFFYLPFTHSERLEDQALCVELTGRIGDERLRNESLRYARMHRDIIERFGRFPHRNAVLGRAMTADEEKFLQGGGFSG